MAAVTQSNIDEFRVLILDWFFIYGRHFPWRDKDLNYYQLVIAEILLQRTKAETVAKFYQKFIIDFPTWEALDRANLNLIEDALKPVGLYRQRALRLKKLAGEMVHRKGILPSKRQDLEEISFMGQYIANAVELLIHKKRVPLIDVNMARVVERYFGKREMADIRYDPYLQALAYRIVDSRRAKEINWAILDFAALVCKAIRPLCSGCRFKRKCLYYATQVR
jgi:A/G-specific adenine glycosylase